MILDHACVTSAVLACRGRSIFAHLRSQLDRHKEWYSVGVKTLRKELFLQHLVGGWPAADMLATHPLTKGVLENAAVAFDRGSGCFLHTFSACPETRGHGGKSAAGGKRAAPIRWQHGPRWI